LIRVALGLCLLLALLTVSVSSAAGERRLVLTTAGNHAEARALALVARDLMGRLGVELEVATAEAVDPAAVINRPSDFSPALARAWVDLTPGDHAMLYIVDGPWERVLIRRVPRDAGHLEVAREELGHILETAVEAMLSGARIGLERSALEARPPSPPPRPRPVPPPPPEPPAPAPPPSPPAPPVELRVGVYEQATLLADAAPVTGALGVSASIETPTAARWGAWLTFDYRWPVRTHSLPLGVRIQGFEVRALGRATVLRSYPWKVDVAFGPGIDLMDAKAVANRPGNVTLTPEGTDASFVLRAAVGVRWRSLGLWLVGDADLTGRTYPFRLNGQDVDALAPYRVRPGLLLEASFR